MPKKKSVKTKAPKKSAKKAAKKTTKKAAPKAKNVTKIEVTIKRSILGEAPEEYHFVLGDGKKLKNVFELVDSLAGMEEDIFKEHVNEMKNDFSNWIRDVFDEDKLADEISRIEDRFETERKLMRHLIDELRKAAKI